VISNQNENNSTSTQNRLQMDEEQCRRLNFGAEPRMRETHSMQSSKIHVLEVLFIENQCKLCSHSKGTYFSLRKSQIAQSNCLS